MRLLLKITLGVFGLFSLMIGLRFILGRNSAPDEPWFLIHDYSSQITRVTQSGKVDTLHTHDGLPVYGSVFNYEDGWLWGDLTLPQPRNWRHSRMRLDGSHWQPLRHPLFREQMIGLSGNRQWVLFTGDEYDRDIYRVRTNGSWPHRLVDLPGHDRPVGFTADGDWLLFTNGNYYFDLWRVNTNTGERVQLTHDLLIESVGLSPDRQWVYFAFKDDDYLTEGDDLARLRVDGNGTDLQQLTNTHAVNAFWQRPDWSWLMGDGLNFKPALISPDGRWLLYYAMMPAGSDYFAMSSDGQSVHQLHIEGDILDWSPDSRWIYYKKADSGLYPNGQQGSGHFYRMQPDGSDQQLVSPLVFDQPGRLSEDGKWIFVQVMDNPTLYYRRVKDYYGLATDGSATWHIAGEMGDVLEDTFSLDGKWYFFLAWNAEYQYADLYRIPVGVTQPPEKIAQFGIAGYGNVGMLGWFKSPHKAWSPLLILGAGLGCLAFAAGAKFERQVIARTALGKVNEGD